MSFVAKRVNAITLLRLHGNDVDCANKKKNFWKADKLSYHLQKFRTILIKCQKITSSGIFKRPRFYQKFM